MLFVSTLLIVFAIVVIQGCCCRDRYYVETITRASEDTTYCIIDGKNNEIVYHAGYNPISKEEVIKPETPSITKEKKPISIINNILSRNKKKTKLVEMLLQFIK